MKLRLSPLFIALAFFFCLVSRSIFAQEAPPNSPVEFIIQKVIHKIAENEVSKKTLTYKRVHIIENLDDKEQVTDKEKEEVTLIEIGGKESVIWLNGKQVKRSKTSQPDFDLVKALNAMSKLDEFQIIRLEMIDSRPYYLISFKAKSGIRARGDVEDIMVRSEGEMYVDIEKFYIKKLTAKLIREYERCFGCFKLMRADFTVEQEEFDGIIVMKSITIIDKFYALKNFGVTFERKTYTYKDYGREN